MACNCNRSVGRLVAVLAEAEDCDSLHGNLKNDLGQRWHPNQRKTKAQPLISTSYYDGGLVMAELLQTSWVA